MVISRGKFSCETKTHSFDQYVAIDENGNENDEDSDVERRCDYDDDDNEGDVTKREGDERVCVMCFVDFRLIFFKMYIKGISAFARRRL